MAIFGWNGMMAAAIYLSLIGAVYGTKDTQIKNYAEIARLVGRKAASEVGDKAGRKRAYKEINAARLRAAQGVKGAIPLEKSFEEAFMKKQYVR